MSAHADRLSAVDASFLAVETETAPMHVGAVMVFEPGPLVGADGGVDFAKVEAYIAALLGRAPRDRQRLRRTPVLGHPAWVDDDAFDIRYHLRHTSLPRPGDDVQLKRLAGRIFSQRLDPARPLWEMWLVEGLGERRFALISKIHHCMLDGIAGVDFMVEMLRGTPDATLPPPAEVVARPAPRPTELLRLEARHRLRATRAGLARLATQTPRQLATTVRALATTLFQGLMPAPATPLNPHAVSPHRQLDWLRLPLADVKAVKNRLGGTVNDVVLAIVCGALLRYLGRLGLDAGRFSGFRALLPVNMRAADQRGQLGNRVALLLARLPIDEPDPKRRLAKVREETEYLKGRSHMAQASDLLSAIGDAVAPSLVNELVRLTVSRRSFNVVITNVPGPPFALWFLGSKMAEVYPVLPIYPNQRLGFGIFSHEGALAIALHADRDAPGLDGLADDLRAAFAELQSA